MHADISGAVATGAGPEGIETSRQGPPHSQSRGEGKGPSSRRTCRSTGKAYFRHAHRVPGGSRTDPACQSVTFPTEEASLLTAGLGGRPVKLPRGTEFSRRVQAYAVVEHVDVLEDHSLYKVHRRELLARRGLALRPVDEALDHRSVPAPAAAARDPLHCVDSFVMPARVLASHDPIVPTAWLADSDWPTLSRLHPQPSRSLSHRPSASRLSSGRTDPQRRPCTTSPLCES
jgi:hypothetical protein